MEDTPPNLNGRELQEYRIKYLEKKVEQLSDSIYNMKSAIEKRDRERSIEEGKKLWLGISTLGGIVLTLAGVIWSYREVIFQGKMP